MSILRIDASPRGDHSVSRRVLDRVEAKVGRANVRRDLDAEPLPHLNGTWTAATFTQPAERSPAQREALAQSDALVAELQAADTILISLPMYNFTVPSSLKAYFDLVARVGVTFRYTETGPEGLLKGKRAIVAIATGGTKIGSEIDFATPYIRFFLGFIGIDDVSFVAAEKLMADAEAGIEAANGQVEALAA
jgi:FMN-dependent NADH-azoreductase